MFETVLLLVLLSGVLLFSFILISAFLGFLATRVPFVRSPKSDLQKAFQRLPLQDGQVFLDLGSGDGFVVFAAEELADVKARGYEQTLWTHVLAKWKAKLKHSKAEFFQEDFFKVSWADADVIYCYLYPPLMPKIEAKFLAEAKPGARLVARDFPLPSLEPAEVMLFGARHEVFFYEKAK